MREVYNYNAVKDHEMKIYSLSGETISTEGVTASYIKMFSGFMVISIIINVIIYLTTKKIVAWPITSEGFKPWGLTFSVGIPAMLSSLLLNTKISSYRTLDFIVAYMKPKKVINNKKEIQTRNKYKIKTFIENLDVF